MKRFLSLALFHNAPEDISSAKNKKASSKSDFQDTSAKNSSCPENETNSIFWRKLCRHLLNLIEKHIAFYIHIAGRHEILLIN